MLTFLLKSSVFIKDIGLYFLVMVLFDLGIRVILDSLNDPEIVFSFFLNFWCNSSLQPSGIQLSCENIFSQHFNLHDNIINTISSFVFNQLDSLSFSKHLFR